MYMCWALGGAAVIAVRERFKVGFTFLFEFVFNIFEAQKTISTLFFLPNLGIPLFFARDSQNAFCYTPELFCAWELVTSIDFDIFFFFKIQCLIFSGKSATLQLLLSACKSKGLCVGLCVGP